MDARGFFSNSILYVNSLWIFGSNRYGPLMDFSASVMDDVYSYIGIEQPISIMSATSENVYRIQSSVEQGLPADSDDHSFLFNLFVFFDLVGVLTDWCLV